MMHDEAIFRIGSDSYVAPSGSAYWAGVLAAPAWRMIAPGKGTVDVEIEITDPEKEWKPSPRQLAACAWFVDHEAEMVLPVLEAIVSAYPHLQALYGYDDEEAARLMPPVHVPADLLPLIDIRQLYIHDVAYSDLPYIGFTFGCTWDQEHQLGVLMHGLRAIDVGDGDVAFDWQAPRRDAEQQTTDL